jgi:hypothetical protein
MKLAKACAQLNKVQSKIVSFKVPKQRIHLVEYKIGPKNGCFKAISFYKLQKNDDPCTLVIHLVRGYVKMTQMKKV